MLAFTRRAAGQRGRRRLPRSLLGLSTPNLKRGWGDMKDLTREEKTELLHGTWRAATPVQLAPAVVGTRGGHEGAEAVSFPTEEAAQEYLDEESRDELAESHASTLAMAQQFFVDLAATADAEVDAAQMPPAAQSDEERRREMRDVQREFYGDYYVEQGLVPAALRYAFVDAMLRPSRPLFLVNSVLPLARLTVRDQLEAHSSTSARGGDHDGVSLEAGADAALPASTSPVFAPTPFDPCLYAIPLPPTQALGAPLHVPFSAATSHIGESGADATTLLADGAGDPRRASSATAHDAGSSSAVDAAPLIEDADALGLMMSMDAPLAEGDVRDEPEPTCGEPTAVMGAPASVPLVQPPRLEHLYWLQRQVACDTLLNVDDVSLLVSLLSVRLAAAAAPTTPSPMAEPLPPYQLILYKAATGGEAASTCLYLTELAQYWYRAVQDVTSADDATSSAVLTRLQRVVVAVEDASIPHHTQGPPRQSRGSVSPSRSHEALPLCEVSTVPVADRFPNVVYLSPYVHPLRSRRDARGRCRVVVCVPATSQDGVRPRGWLDGGDAAEDDPDAADTPFTLEASRRRSAARHRGGFAGAPPNTFVERCERANSNFPLLQRQLYDAVRCTGLGCEASCCDEGDRVGYVVYATQSANVIENEAVVCAVLHRLAEAPADRAETHDHGGSTTHRAAPGLRVECVPLDAPDLHASLASSEASAMLTRLERHGRRGLDTWVAIESGAAGQEPDVYSDALRGAVAAAAWRTDAMRTGSDGGFVVCLRVTRPVTPARVREEPSARAEDVVPAAPCLWWTHPDSRVVSAVTPATQCFLEDVRSRDVSVRAAVGAVVVHAGVPCGLVGPAVSQVCSADASVLPTTVQLSSTTPHVDVVAAFRRSLPRLTLSVHALCEVLRLKEVQARTLRRLLRQREKQSPLQRKRLADDVEDENVAFETQTFLQAVEGCCDAVSRSAPPQVARSRVHVLLEIDAASLLPKGMAAKSNTVSATRDTDDADADAEVRALHPAVLAELEAVGVVAEIEFTRRVRSCPEAPIDDFSLRLSVPPEMPEWAKHTAALQGWCVALRDALLYVLRRTGEARASTNSVQLWAEATRGSDDATAATGEDRSEGWRGDEVRLPNAGDVLELASDEYEAVMPTPLEAHLRPTDAAPTLPDAEDVRDQRADWMRDTNCQEWRRRRRMD